MTAAMGGAQSQAGAYVSSHGSFRHVCLCTDTDRHHVSMPYRLCFGPTVVAVESGMLPSRIIEYGLCEAQARQSICV